MTGPATSADTLSDPRAAWALVERAIKRRREGDAAGSLALLEQASEVDPTHSNIKVEIARDLRALSRLPEAEAAVEQVLLRDPDHLWALVEKGHVRRRQGDLAGAAALFERASQIDPGNPNIRLELARDLRLLGRTDEADAVLDLVLAADPGHLWALVEKGHARRRRGDIAGSAELFDQAAAIDPANLDIKMELARDLRALNRLDAAQGALDPVLAENPHHFAASVELGFVRRAQGDGPGALTAFAAAAKINPMHTGVRGELARELRREGRIEEAVAELRDIAALAPKDSGAHLALGQVLMELQRLDEAEASLAVAREADPDNAWVSVALGQLARRRGDSAAAAAHFLRAAERRPDNHDVKLELAAHLREAGALDEARTLIDAVLGSQVGHWNGWMQRGFWHRVSGDHAAALVAFRRAAGIQPSNMAAVVEMAREQWALGRPKAASELLRRARRADPPHALSWVVSAEYALVGEDFNAALRLARRALEIDPGGLAGYLVASRAAAGNLDFEQARGFLDRARETLGPAPAAAVVAAQLHRLQGEFVAARAVMNDATARFGSDFGVWHEKAMCALAVGAFNEVEAALAAAPGQTQWEKSTVQRVRAQLAAARHDHRSAVEAYQTALALAPFDPGLHYEITRSHLLLGQTEDARRHLKAWVTLNGSNNAVRRQSPNPSQNHFGQMLDDFVLDRMVLERLLEADGRPAEERLAAIAAVVSSQPDATAPAIFLLRAAMETALADSQPKPAIPRRICQFWDGAPPPDVQELMNSWPRINEGYQYGRFNDASAARYIARRHPRDVLRAFTRSTHPAQRADVFRLAWLAADGGFYVDADDLCLAPISGFAPPAATLVGYREDVGTLANNFIGATRGHPVILRALELVTTAINRGDNDMIWLLSGPGLTTRAFAQVVAEDESILHSGATAIFELWQMTRVIAMHRRVGYKRTPRHWSRAVFQAKGGAGPHSASAGRRRSDGGQKP